jgi:hypothetical protein
MDQTPSGLVLPAGMSAGAERQTTDKEARRVQLHRWDVGGPWGATVTLTEVRHGGRQSGRLGQPVTYEVGCQWTGPPMHGAPPAAGAVQSADAWWTDRGELAERVARAACDCLRAPRVPELRAIARDLA